MGSTPSAYPRTDQGAGLRVALETPHDNPEPNSVATCRRAGPAVSVRSIETTRHQRKRSVRTARHPRRSPNPSAASLLCRACTLTGRFSKGPAAGLQPIQQADQTCATLALSRGPQGPAREDFIQRARGSPFASSRRLNAASAPSPAQALRTLSRARQASAHPKPPPTD